MNFEDWRLREIIYEEIRNQHDEQDTQNRAGGERTANPSFVNEGANVETDVLTGDASTSNEE